MIERRFVSENVDVRGRPEEGAVISGYASVFDVSYDVWGFKETVARGAFTKTISEHRDIAALWNHDSNIVLGRVRNKTLRLQEDDHGLFYEVDLPDTQAARDLYTLIERGDVYQSSFAFEAVKEDWDADQRLRILREVRLYDVSPVTYPASPTTAVDVQRAMRSLAAVTGRDATELVEAACSGRWDRIWVPSWVLEERGVVPYQDLPLADRDYPWDADAALARVRDWAGGEEWRPERYRQAFLWYDSDAPELLGSYKLPIADIVDGALMAVPRAIFAAAAAIQGARGGVDIPSEDVPRVKAHLNRYYERLDMTPPWSGRSAHRPFHLHMLAT